MRIVSLVSLLVLAAGLAHAQSLPPQGEVNVTFTATNTNVVCTENSDSDILMVKSAQHWT